MSVVNVSKNELINDILLKTSTHGHTSISWPVKTYVHQRCYADTGIMRRTSIFQMIHFKVILAIIKLAWRNVFGTGLRSRSRPVQTPVVLLPSPSDKCSWERYQPSYSPAIVWIVSLLFFYKNIFGIKLTRKGNIPLKERSPHLYMYQKRTYYFLACIEFFFLCWKI